ncbi:CidA/LrgA family protein [Neobacillus sp. WH10]|uniref:CidA/LrgA family protein n=1 Tax=Neobacillus sp. WH10 TaxID=3047873 RepID=UPI0024C132A7|nr:CidA/LrgA family protein [Neobacillus sp. WH10]WHY75633.1 CidA/LrgA family protein [Neobacillus sp. WH10]
MMKSVWKFSIQMLFLILVYQVGNWTARFFHLQIPGNVIGIVLLYVLLWLGVIKLEQIELASGWLLKHLGFFFIPISVGLMTLGDIFVAKGLPFLFVLIFSAFIGLLFAGKVTQTVIMKNAKEKVNFHDHAI